LSPERMLFALLLLSPTHVFWRVGCSLQRKL
jgi:hypothetical protein